MTSSRATVLCQYHYDPLDRLTSHILTDTPECQRFYCKDRLATEIQSANRYSIFQQDEQLLAHRQHVGDAIDTTLLGTDLQRSVLQTLKADYPQQPIAYAPYGYRPAEEGLYSLPGFNGERPDPLSGHYLLGNGHRTFNPVLMRFTSPDNLSPFGEGGLNPYAYCSGDPVNFTDQTGKFKFKLFNLIASAFTKTKTSKHANKFVNPSPGQYEHIGYHASTSEHITSLENGLNPKFIGLSRGTQYGPGFYGTKNFSMADSLAQEMARHKDGVTPAVFDIYLKRPKQTIPMRKGTTLAADNLTAGLKEAGDPDHFVISIERYKDVVVKARDIRWQPKKPDLN